MNKYLIAVIVVLVIFVLALAFYGYKKIKSKKTETSKPSKYYKLENYEEMPPQIVSKSTNVSVLLCYANWCGHCPTVKEWYIDLVNRSPLPNVTFTMCEEQDLPAEVLESIPGFPSILIFNNGQMKKYPGDRTKDDLLRYLKNI